MISPCNKFWKGDDINFVGSTEEVTCKRCLKIIERADENGKVVL